MTLDSLIYLVLLLYYKIYGKGHWWAGRWRGAYRARSGGSWVRELLSPWSCGAPPSWHVGVFTTPKTASPLFRMFVEASSLWHFSIFNSSSSFSPLPRGWGWAGSSQLLIMAQSFWWPAPIQEPTKSHLIRTKDILVTQEITGVLEVLFREQRAETRYMFLMSQSSQWLCQCYALSTVLLFYNCFWRLGLEGIIFLSQVSPPSPAPVILLYLFSKHGWKVALPNKIQDARLNLNFRNTMSSLWVYLMQLVCM